MNAPKDNYPCMIYRRLGATLLEFAKNGASAIEFIIAVDVWSDYSFCATFSSSDNGRRRLSLRCVLDPQAQ